MRKSLLLFFIALATLQCTAAASFEYAAWLPYWRKTDAASTTLAHLDQLQQISPFAFELQTDGTIKDALKVEEEPWVSLIAEAKKKGVKVYPSILSYPHNEKERYAAYLLLAQKKRRQAHVKEIVMLVKKHKFDGIDIDYEYKLAEAKPYFSAFLTELSAALKKEKKKLICTIEARTPPENKFATSSLAVLSRIEYSNDFKVIGKVCDQVRIMTYDQGGDDATLINANQGAGNIYKPVADIEWVKRVITLALWDIPAKKLFLGVPTYGYKYEIIPPTSGESAKYSRVGSMNWNYADELARMTNSTPIRAQGGEVYFTYGTTTDANGQPLGAYTNFLVWYSDAQAIADKIKIAKLYRLGGIAVFKIDGGNDPRIWEVLK